MNDETYPEGFWDKISLPPLDGTLIGAWEKYFDRCLKTGKAVNFSYHIARLETARMSGNRDIDIFQLVNVLQTPDPFTNLEKEETIKECLQALRENSELCQEVLLALSGKKIFEDSVLSLHEVMVQDMLLIERNSLSKKFNSSRFDARIDFISHWLPIVEQAITVKINSVLGVLGYSLETLPEALKRKEWQHINTLLLTTDVEYLTGKKQFKDPNEIMSIEEIEVIFGLRQPPREIKRRRSQSSIKNVHDFIEAAKGLGVEDFENIFETLGMPFTDYKDVLSYIPLNEKPLWKDMSIDQVRHMLSSNDEYNEALANLVADVKILMQEQGSCSEWEYIIEAYDNPNGVTKSGLTNAQWLKIVIAQQKQLKRMREMEEAEHHAPEAEKPVVVNGIEKMLQDILEISTRAGSTISYDRAIRLIKDAILNRLESGELEKLLARGKDKRKRDTKNDNKQKEIGYRFKKNGIIVY